MASFKEINKGNWQVTFYCKDYTGTNVKYKKRGFKTKKEAKEYSESFIRKAQGKSDIRICELLEEFLKYKEDRVKPNTLRQMKSTFKHFEGTPLLKIQLNKLDKKDVIKFFDNKNLTPSVYLQCKNFLSTALEYAIIYYNLNQNFVKNNVKPMKSNKKEKEIWTHDEFLKFDEEISKMSFNNKDIYRLIFNMLYYTGARIGEVLGLKLEDIDFQNKIISINRTRISRNFSNKPKTLTSIRKVSFPNNVNDLLIKYVSTLPNVKDDYLFDNSTSNVTNLFRNLIKKINFKKIPLHGLRHSHVSLLINKGVEITAISKRIGHANSSITLSVYSHFYNEKEDKILNILENL